MTKKQLKENLSHLPSTLAALIIAVLTLSVSFKWIPAGVVETIQPMIQPLMDNIFEVIGTLSAIYLAFIRGRKK